MKDVTNQKDPRVTSTGSLGKSPPNRAHFAIADRPRKELSTLIATFALNGYAIHEHPNEGYIVVRWNFSTHCKDIDELHDFAGKLVVSK